MKTPSGYVHKVNVLVALKQSTVLAKLESQSTREEFYTFRRQNSSPVHPPDPGPTDIWLWLSPAPFFSYSMAPEDPGISFQCSHVCHLRHASPPWLEGPETATLPFLSFAHVLAHPVAKTKEPWFSQHHDYIFRSLYLIWIYTYKTSRWSLLFHSFPLKIRNLQEGDGIFLLSAITNSWLPWHLVGCERRWIGDLWKVGEAETNRKGSNIVTWGGESCFKFNLQNSVLESLAHKAIALVFGMQYFCFCPCTAGLGRLQPWGSTFAIAPSPTIRSQLQNSGERDRPRCKRLESL